jgi:rubrerythrin
MNQNRSEMIKNQLIIAQTAIETAYALIETETPKAMCLPDDPDSHPEEFRKDYSTMGITRWQCSKCGFLFEKKESEGA